MNDYYRDKDRTKRLEAATVNPAFLDAFIEAYDSSGELTLHTRDADKHISRGFMPDDDIKREIHKQLKLMRGKLLMIKEGAR